MNYITTCIIQVSLQLIQWQDILSEAQPFELRGSCGPHRSRHSKFDYRIDYPDTHLPPPLLITL